MPTASRRGFLGALAATGAAFTASRVNAAPEEVDVGAIAKDTDVACLYHCDFGDAARFSDMLNNINNHLSAYEFDPMKIRVVIVAHGPGLKFFLEDLSSTPWANESLDPDLYIRLKGLSMYDVEAYLCQITYRRMNIDPAKTRADSFLKLVPSGVATVAELQAKGFGYLKVG